jgi:hypothetical protein
MFYTIRGFYILSLTGRGVMCRGVMCRWVVFGIGNSRESSESDNTNGDKKTMMAF